MGSDQQKRRAWGNQFLWGYDESMDAELQEVFNLAVSSGVTLFDTADSYGAPYHRGSAKSLALKFCFFVYGIF